MIHIPNMNKQSLDAIPHVPNKDLNSRSIYTFLWGARTKFTLSTKLGF